MHWRHPREESLQEFHPVTTYTMSLGDRILRFLFPDTFRRISEMTQASDRLSASVAALSPKVDALIALEQAGNQDALLNSAADAIDAISAKIDAANPPAEPVVED